MRRACRAVSVPVVNVAVGLKGEARLTVGEADTARSLGSGDVDVLGTPKLVALFEQATVEAYDLDGEPFGPAFDGTVTGANELQAQYEEQFGPGDYTPNVWIAFYSFRLMMGFGLVGAAWMLVAWWRTRKGRLPEGRIFWAISIWIVFTPWLGNMFGWIFTENGRQPWVVYNMLKTEDAVSSISPSFLYLSLPIFFLLYGAFAIVEFILMRRYVIAGPIPDDKPMAGEPAADLPKQVV